MENEFLLTIFFIPSLSLWVVKFFTIIHYLTRFPDTTDPDKNELRPAIFLSIFRRKYTRAHIKQDHRQARRVNSPIMAGEPAPRRIN